MSQSCPSCKEPASGRFCSHCGAVVSSSAACRECSASLQPGARFCNECGAAAASVVATAAAPQAAGRSLASRAPWAIAAVAVVVFGGLAVIQQFGDRAAASPTFAPTSAGAQPGAAGTLGGARGVDLSSMTPREAADRLFDRVMRTAAAGDSAEARGFVPMALGAYDLVPDAEMDTDARYHLGVLHLLNGEPDQARAVADGILADDANHLFGLFVAAQAARQKGNAEEATGFYRRFLDAYPTEVSRDLPEYTAHAPAFPEMRAEAQASVQGRR